MYMLHQGQGQPPDRLRRCVRRSHGRPCLPDGGPEGEPLQLPADARHGPQRGRRHRLRRRGGHPDGAVRLIRHPYFIHEGVRQKNERLRSFYPASIADFVIFPGNVENLGNGNWFFLCRTRSNSVVSRHENVVYYAHFLLILFVFSDKLFSSRQANRIFVADADRLRQKESWAVSTTKILLADADEEFRHPAGRRDQW